MKKNTIPILSIVLLLASSTANGQSTLNASGGHANIGVNSFEYSIGEMAVVSTYASTSLVITQGVLQPKAPAPNSIVGITPGQLRVYPNPAVAIVNIQSEFAKPGILKAVLLDITGRLMITKNWDLKSGATLNLLDISKLAQGNYLLRLMYNEEEITYKIQKTN